MDGKLRNLQRLSTTDEFAKARYIRELERIVGLGEPHQALKCLVTACPNHDDEGGGLYLLTQNSVDLGGPPQTWDQAVGPLFLCGPCYQYMKNEHRRGSPSNSRYRPNVNRVTPPRRIPDFNKP